LFWPRCWSVKSGPISGLMAAAVSLLLGGIVVCGSNSSTAKEATKELAASESERAALIEHINPRVIS
jgi:hypothetical protein